MNMQDMLPVIQHVCEWIRNYNDQHKHERVAVSSRDWPRLGDVFDKALLDRSYFVITDAIETPQLSTLVPGSPVLFDLKNCAGITYGDTYYLLAEQDENESIHFHELIHTIQWDELGFEGFVTSYASRLLSHGYQNSPLEVIAFHLQTKFDSGEQIKDIEAIVRQHARENIGLIP